MNVLYKLPSKESSVIQILPIIRLLIHKPVRTVHEFFMLFLLLNKLAPAQIEETLSKYIDFLCLQLTHLENQGITADISITAGVTAAGDFCRDWPVYLAVLKEMIVMKQKKQTRLQAFHSLL